MTHSTGKSLCITSSISDFPKMSRYCDFPVPNDANIQTHFQLEKHIVFHQMINHIDLKCERKNVKTIK